MNDFSQTRVILYGAGGHAAVVEAAMSESGDMLCAAVIDDGIPAGTTLLYQQVAGTAEVLPALLEAGTTHIHIAIADNSIRSRLTDDVSARGFILQTVQHATAVKDPSAVIGAGTFLAAGSIVCVRTRIGTGCIINTGATIDHDCHIGDFSHMCPGVHIAGEVQIGQRCMIGTGAVVIPQIKIGAESIIGAGAVVIQDVPPGTTVVGVPARPI